MPTLSITILEGASAIESVAAEWDEALPQSFTAALSQSSWYLAWQQAFPPKRAVAVVAREGNRLVGLLPMALVKTDARGLYFRQATTYAGGDYQSPVIASGAGPEVLPALLDASLEYFGRRIVYRFASIPNGFGRANSTFPSIVQRYGSRGTRSNRPPIEHRRQNL